MDSSFANLFAGFEEVKESTKIDIPLGEKRKFIPPASLKNPKLEELMTFLIDWINATLKEDHIVVKSLEEDLYDGLVLHHLLVHLGKVNLDVEEIALSASAQKRKLSVVLDRVNQLLQVTEDDYLNWNADLIHNKDLIATLHLLVAIAKLFRPDIPLPENVCLEALVIEIDKTGIKTTKHLECITEKRRDDEEQNQTQETDKINDLFKLKSDKIKVVQQALLHFVNKHVGRLGVTVKDLSTQIFHCISPTTLLIYDASPFSNREKMEESWYNGTSRKCVFGAKCEQFSNGVILILLIGQLEGYFIHLSEYYLNPSDDKEKLHNVSFVLGLLEDRGLLNYPINPQDIVNLDTKATIRILHCLFAKYKDK